MKIAKIEGKIPSIDSKIVKMGNFALLNRKIYPYLLRNELHSAINRKIYPYFKYLCFLMKSYVFYNGRTYKVSPLPIGSVCFSFDYKAHMAI